LLKCLLMHKTIPMDINGLLLVDKPQDMTSHDVVDILRKKLQIRKIGHAGTLDPAATGLLLLLISKQATKQASNYADLGKTYDVRLTLGVKTDTGDHTGKVLTSNDIPALTNDQIEEVFQKFPGDLLQVPPMVSAKKVKGKKLYELARKGITIPRQPQKIRIEKIEITDIELPHIGFIVTCSKGTYIRTLCEDIGDALGCQAHMSALRRTKIGNFRVEDAISVKNIKETELDNIVAKVRNI